MSYGNYVTAFSRGSNRIESVEFIRVVRRVVIENSKVKWKRSRAESQVLSKEVDLIRETAWHTRSQG